MRPTLVRAEIRSTTILGIVADGRAALGGDGQVTLGSTIVKSNARKIRTLAGGRVLAGFAGSAADALQLFERFEGRLEAHGADLQRAAVELAREWRSDRVLRRLSAQLVAIDRERVLLVSGTGDVIEPDDGILAIGSGGPYALSAARALRRHASLSLARTVEEALRIATEVCVYSGGTLGVLTLDPER